MRILFYGRLAESIAPEIELDVPPGASVADVRDRLVKEHSLAAESLTNRRVLTCADGVLVRDDHVVTRAERLEFLPPVSGG